IVLDFGACARLSPRRNTFDDHRGEPLRRGVDSSRETGRPASDYRDVVDGALVRQLRDAELVGEPGNARAMQYAPIAEDHGGPGVRIRWREHGRVFVSFHRSDVMRIAVAQ